MRFYIIDPNYADVDFVGPSGFSDSENGLAVRPSDGTILNTPIDANGLVILNRNTGGGSVIPPSVDNLPGKIGALDFKPDNVLYGVQKSSRIRMAKPAVIELNGEEEKAKYLIISNQSNGVTTTVG